VREKVSLAVQRRTWRAGEVLPTLLVRWSLRASTSSTKPPKSNSAEANVLFSTAAVLTSGIRSRASEVWS
jgi:hypothetical protein